MRNSGHLLTEKLTQMNFLEEVKDKQAAWKPESSRITEVYSEEELSGRVLKCAYALSPKAKVV